MLIRTQLLFPDGAIFTKQAEYFHYNQIFTLHGAIMVFLVLVPGIPSALGNFTLPMARHAAEVVGVEGEQGLVERAAANAARNGLANVSFRVANLFDDQRSAPWASQAWDKILLDPPRAGADKVLEYLPRKGTNRIVYVSCHPGSLARDAGILVAKHGFRLVSAGVMDMFPHTAHVESIALFERG